MLIDEMLKELSIKIPDYNFKLHKNTLGYKVKYKNNKSGDEGEFIWNSDIENINEIDDITNELRVHLNLKS